MKSDMDLTRRGALKLAAGAGAVGVTGSITGCVGLLGGGGGQYANWLYEPGTISDSDHYLFIRLEGTTMDEYEDELGETADNISNFFVQTQPVDVDLDEMEVYLGFQSSAVVQTTLDRDDIIDDLEDTDFDDETDHAGYTIYANEDETRAAGVDGSDIVFGDESGGEDAVEVVETALDTQNGDEDRYTDENEDFQLLVDELGDGTFVAGRTYEETTETNAAEGNFENEVAAGTSATIDGDTTEVTRIRVFEQADDVDVDAIEEWIDENDNNDETFDDHENIDVTHDGRAAVITSDVPTEDW